MIKTMTKALALTAAIGVMGFAGQALAADVVVTLNGVQPTGGTMLLSLQSKEQFNNPMNAKGAVAPATAGTMTLTVPDVPPGDYAIMVLHDADNNWQPTAGPDGKYTEGTANSGQVKTGWKFEELKFTVPAEGASVTLEMRYPK